MSRLRVRFGDLGAVELANAPGTCGQDTLPRERGRLAPAASVEGLRGRYSSSSGTISWTVPELLFSSVTPTLPGAPPVLLMT